MREHVCAQEDDLFCFCEVGHVAGVVDASRVESRACLLPRPSRNQNITHLLSRQLTAILAHVPLHYPRAPLSQQLAITRMPLNTSEGVVPDELVVEGTAGSGWGEGFVVEVGEGEVVGVAEVVETDVEYRTDLV